MPVELAPAVDPSSLVYPPRKRWTRAECGKIQATGLWDCESLELIDGELIVKSPQKRPHVIVLTSAMKWLSDAFDLIHLNLLGSIDVCA